MKSFHIKRGQRYIEVKDCFGCPNCLHNVEVIENKKTIAVTICSDLMRNIIKHKREDSNWELWLLFWREYGAGKIFPDWCPRLKGKNGRVEKAQEDDFVSTF